MRDTVLLLLKDIIEILASSCFTEETLFYLDSKISDHRNLLKEEFPDLRLRPKHHYIEHYPHLIRSFGPLTDFWTIRFKAKHSFFKKTVRDAHNCKNILLTLANQHQFTLAYLLDMPSVFKPNLEVGHLAVLPIESLDQRLKVAIQTKHLGIDSVCLATKVFIDGIEFTEGMFISNGHTGCLPDFSKIVKILVIFNKAEFIVQPYSAWYLEHLRCYELIKNPASELQLVETQEMNGHHPLSGYTVGRRLCVVPKTFLLQQRYTY